METLSKTGTMAERKSRLLIIAAFAAVYLIWGSTYLGIKYAIETIPPFLMTGSRYFIAGVILFAIAIWKGSSLPTLMHLKNTAIIGFLLLVVGNGGVVWAVQEIPSGVAALLITIEPLWIVILLWFRKNGKRPERIVWLGISLGISGMIILIGPRNLEGIMNVDPLRAFAIIVSTFGWALGSLYSVRATLPSSSVMSTGIQMMLGGIMLVSLGCLNGEFALLDFEGISDQSYIAFLYLIVFGSVIGGSSYNYLVQVETPNRVSTYAYVNPVIAVFLGCWVGGEPLNSQTLMAAVLLITAVVLIILKPFSKPI
jgi:drug/metabolite transporter (DMT)-like permease